MISVLSPTNFKDYTLLDSGDGSKLERFGEFVLIRPEPQAVWRRSLSLDEWEKQAHARFDPEGSSAGSWTKINSQMPDTWWINYRSGKLRLRFRLALTRFQGRQEP